MPKAKPAPRNAPSRVYRLRIELLDLEPAIWRTILVPDTLTLARLDRVVQAAMGWTGSHLHDWRIGGKRYGMVDPEWDEPGAMFDERKFKVGEVLGEHIDEFGYEYDFGDGWRHRIAVEKRLPADPERNAWPMCIAGANACPPEDVGGPPGYLDFLEAMHDPAHVEHLDRWQWNAGPFDPTAFSLNDANRAIGRVR